jgi:lipopolysaccharide transport system ATP-binding protein
MSNLAIEIKNISKKYNITHQQGGYVALRDVIMNILKNPFKHAKNKAKEVIGMETKEEFWALKDINVTIKKGEIVGIIGANGAGKSTLLKLLSQITPPTTGEIKINGRIASLLEVGTGFHPELTGRENIFLNGAILGMTKKEIVERFDKIVEFSGVKQFVDTPVKRYSSGMYVRLAFAVAAHMEPDVLVVDEVLAVGDAEFQKKSLGKLDEVSKTNGRTILFVSHNMAAIQKLCKRTILLEKGRIKAVGETKEIIKRYLETTDKNIHLPLSNRNDRTGTGNIQFKEIKLSGRNNSNIYSIGDDIYVNLKITNSYSKNTSVSIILNILTVTAQPLISCDSLLKDETYILPASSTSNLQCKISSPPINIGDYHLNIGIIRSGELEDRIATVGEFSIKTGEFNKHKKVNNFFPVLCNFDWEIT